MKEIIGKLTKNQWIAIIVAAAAVLVIALSVTLVLLLNGKADEPVYADHNVTVIDMVGRPIKDVMVKFIGNDGTSKTRVTGEDGIATYKNALVGNFKIEIKAGTSSAVIETPEYKFADGSSELTVVLRNSETSTDIYGDRISEGSFAGTVSSGEYQIPAGKSGLDYYVFSAKTAGTYKISINSSNLQTTVGYYGHPMVVRTDDIYAGKNDGKGYELVVQEAGAPYVIGVDRKDASAFTLKIERLGDAPFDPAFAPWTVVPATEDFEKCVIPAGKTLVDLDVTDATLSATLGADGYYHTADGALVYIRIKSASKYWETELARLVGQMDNTTGINIGGYLYDSEGNYLNKYSYNDMIISYIDYCDDENGVYPLTKELADAIKFHGERAGWWTPTSINYLFADYDEIKENAWLFICCVAK